MTGSLKRWSKTAVLIPVLGVLTALGAVLRAGAAEVPAPRTCEKIRLTGEVSAGHNWKEPFGEGWVFRVLPIPKNKTADGVDGWDLVVDRENPEGFPDALLLATPPYDLINSREIGNTFGLRAQDAIGWNPRHFRFMTNRRAFRQAQKLYLFLDRYGELGGKPKITASGRRKRALQRAMQRFVKLAQESSPGEFRILDARITPGTAKVKPYAVNWAAQSATTPHTDQPAPGGMETPLGRLEWTRFSVTLWLPGSWRTPKGVEHPRVPCPK